MLSYLPFVVSIIGIVIILINYIRNINNKTAWIHMFFLFIEVCVLIICITDLS